MYKKYILIALVILPIMAFSSVWIVDAAGSGHFTSIQDAIDDEYNLISEADTILVENGIYYEEVVIRSSTPDNLTLCSNFHLSRDYNDIETTIINGNNSCKGIRMSGTDNMKICGFTVTNCHSNSGLSAAGITIGENSSCSNITLMNCEINNCVNDNIGGGAIKINNGSYYLIDSCIIENNINDGDNINHPNHAAGINIITTVSETHVEVKNCVISNNNGGGIDIDTTNPAVIASLEIKKSLICANTTQDDGAAIDPNYCSINMMNCTVIDNQNFTPNTNVWGLSQSDNSSNTQNISNSIILDKSDIYNDDLITYCGLLDIYSMVPNPATGSTANFTVTAEDVFIASDPLYRLSVDSPCIDAGNPDNDGDLDDWIFDEDDQDADGSRLSIGYYPYEEQDRWEFVDEDIVWMSFPKLPCSDGENNGDMVLAKDILGRFEETTTPDIQLWHENKIENTASFTGIYDENSFIYDWSSEIYSFNSTDGLKIRIEDNFYSLNPLITGGLLCEPDTPVTVTTGAGDLNWVGYFLPDTKFVFDAFDASTLNKLSMIKTHDWTIFRDKQGNWIGGIQPGGYLLKYGDLVELFPKNDQSNFTFCWQMFGSTEEEYSRQETQYFTYEEELDYQSIFIELGETHPDEIAVYVDGECKGAEVVDVDSLLEIRAYILSEPQGQEIEIVTTSGRSCNTSANYQVLDDNNKLVNRKLFTDSGKKYQRISLKKAEEVPEPQDIISCYPNPFNPQLTISYTLAESIDNLEIHIYNAKGQKVRTIENTAPTPGTNSVIWNGDNDSGKMVSSGVYFINMQINDKLYTKKAVLMK